MKLKVKNAGDGYFQIEFKETHGGDSRDILKTFAIMEHGYGYITLLAKVGDDYITMFKDELESSTITVRRRVLNLLVGFKKERMTQCFVR